MRRYLAIALLIGAVSAFITLLLWRTATWGGPLGDAFHGLYQRLGLVPGNAVPTATGLLTWITVPAVAMATAWCMVDIPRPALKLAACSGIGAAVVGLSPTLALFTSVWRLSETAVAPAALPYWLLDPAAPLFAGLIAIIGGTLYGRTPHGRRRRLLFDLAGASLSRSSLDRWIDAGDPLPLSGEMRELTILRCRIFNLTELQGKLSAGELLVAGNEFLRASGDFLLGRGAFLEESPANECLAVFGLGGTGDHADAASAAALKLRTRLENLAVEHQSRWNLSPQFGIAVATGEIAIGRFGPAAGGRLGFNGALLEHSRQLCDANEGLGSQLLLDERARELAGDKLDLRPLDLDRHWGPGLTGTACFQLLGTADEMDDETRQRRQSFARGIEHLRNNRRAKALDCFRKAREPDRSDPVIEVMIQRSSPPPKRKPATRSPKA